MSAGPAIERRAVTAFWALAFLTWAGAWWAGAGRPQPDLYPFMMKAWPGARYEALDATRFEVRRDGRLVGFATTGSDYGYGGPMTLAVGLTPEGQIHSLAVLEYRDTPDLLERARGVLRSLLGKGAGDPFRIGEDVDAVSGATYSSRGLANAALAGARRIAERTPLATEGRSRVSIGGAEFALFGLIAVTALGRNRRAVPAGMRRALRWLALLGGLVALGVVFNDPWVIAFPIRLLTRDWPSWQTHLFWYGLLATVLVSFSRSGKSPYCPWMCPFGSAQDLVGLPLGAHRRRLRATRLFAWLKRGLLWLAVLLGLYYRTPGAGSYEVFGTLFRWTGTGWQFAVLFFVGVAALFVRRPFCHWLCPVDAMEQGLRPVRRAIVGRRSAASRPVALPLVVEGARRPGLADIERFRGRLAAALGLLCVLLVLGHLHERFESQARGAQEGLMGRTFLTVEQR